MRPQLTAQRVELFTKSGAHLDTITMPPFAVPPDVILWNGVSFVPRAEGGYREALRWLAMPGGEQS